MLRCRNMCVAECVCVCLNVCYGAAVVHIHAGHNIHTAAHDADADVVGMFLLSLLNKLRSDVVPVLHHSFIDTNTTGAGVHMVFGVTAEPDRRL